MPNKLAESFQKLEHLYQSSLSSLDHLYVYALNYMYVDLKNETLLIVGTESNWMNEMIKSNLHQKIANRFMEQTQIWEANTEFFKAYDRFIQNHQTISSWYKTDIVVKESQGVHLLEISHYQPLPLDTKHYLNDAFETFRFDRPRLHQQYPNLLFPIQDMQPYYSAQAEQKQTDVDTMKLELDMKLFEPMPEPALSHAEKRALSLRVQWYEDDEIAEAMECSLADVRALFEAVKDKYQQPKIPPRVYDKIRQETFATLLKVG
jgi:hypothetical protein